MTQGPSWNWSAPGTNYKIIVSEWAEKEITKNAATSSEYVVSSENVYTAWPVKGTTTVSVDDQTPFYSTEYGYRKQVIAAATTSAPLQPEKFRLIVGGEVIDQMANKKAEIDAYNKLLLNFKNLSAEWTQFLKIEKSIVDMSAFNFLVAKKDQGRVWKGFSRPDPPFEPATYLGPSYKNTTPYFGWGKPSSYEYAPDSPGTQSGKHVQRFKNFGRMGYSSTSGLATVENQKDGTCTASFMAVTIIPKVGYTQSGEVVELVFGSEPYANVDYSDIPTIEKAVPAQSRTDWTAIFP